MALAKLSLAGLLTIFMTQITWASESNPFFDTFGRGINLGNALEAPEEGRWGVTIQEGYFDIIEQAGFDHVRLPVRWSAHAAMEAPYTIDPNFLERIDAVIDQSLERDIAIVLNVHHYEEMMVDPDGHRERFLGIWRQLSSHYSDRPQTLAFELLNEPQGLLSTVKWNSIAAEAIPIVREKNPDRFIIIGPGFFNNQRALPQLALPEDKSGIVATFHYYEPFPFTHQGAAWVNTSLLPSLIPGSGADVNDWVGTEWHGTEEEQASIRKALDHAEAWADANGVPLYLGEYGVIDKADMDSRARWTRFVTDEAIKRDISTAYWEFCAGFGAYDPVVHEWRAPLKDALLPTKAE